MKSIKLFVVALAITFTACKGKLINQPVVLNNVDDSISYFLGNSWGMQLNEVGTIIKLNPDMFAYGFQDREKGLDSLFSDMICQNLYQRFQMKMMESQTDTSAKKKEKNKMIMELTNADDFAEGKLDKSKMKLANFEDSLSYFIGNYLVARNITEGFVKQFDSVNIPILKVGLLQGLAANDTILTKDQKASIEKKYQERINKIQMEEMAKMSAENKAKGTAFLQENKSKEGVIELPSGLQYKVIKEGNGTKPVATDTVEVNYEGMLLDGNVFDSSYKSGKPVRFCLSNVIKGWTEGLALMTPGSTYELYLPSELAYGDQGNQGIPPGSTLIFKVELISVTPGSTK